VDFELFKKMIAETGTGHEDAFEQVIEYDLAPVMLSLQSHFRLYRTPGETVTSASVVQEMFMAQARLRELCAEATEPCRLHGEQEYARAGSFTGFAGGTSYFWELACGCWLADESGDVAAAR
jgi:hypothetical protein